MKRSAVTVTTAVVFSSCVVVSTAFGLVFFAMPLADDFCRADVVVGWPTYVLEMYRSWTGRWLAMALYAGFLPHIDITSHAYSAWLACIWVALFLSFFVLVRLVWGSGLPVRTSIACTVVFSAVFLSGLPSAGEAMYWLTGATEYTLPMALSVLAIGSLARASRYQRGHVKALAWNVAGLGLVAAVTGLHEIAGVTLFLVLLAIAVTARVARVNSATNWTTAVLVAGLGCAVTALAPGNATRLHKDYAGGATGFPQSLHVLRQHVQIYLLPWMTSGRLVLASLFVLSSAKLSSPPAWARAVGRMPLAAVSVMAAVPIVAITLLMSAKVGKLGPLRLYDFSYGVFLAGLLVALVASAGRLRSAAVADGNGALKAVVGVLFALSLLGAPQVLDYEAGLVGTATVMRYHREMARVFHLMQHARETGTRRVWVSAMPTSPYAFSADSMEIGPDASDWRNSCFAQYFHVDSVYAGARHGARTATPASEGASKSHS